MDSPSKQKESVCGSCPWIDRESSFYFDPNTLEKTVVKAIEQERIHSCHKSPTHFCTGYLAFCEKNLVEGVGTFPAGKFGIFAGIIDIAKIPKNLPIFRSVKKMLASHRHRMNQRF